MCKENLKVLYFEGAGMDVDIYEKGSDVGNHRIRTAFIDNEGQEIYLELGGSKFNDKKSSEWKWRIDHVFNLSIDKDENVSSIPIKRGMKTGYTKKNVVEWINKNLNCNFDTIEVLHDLEGYRVHAGYKDGEYHYNLMDNHAINRDKTEIRKNVKEYFNDIEKSEGKKYPNFSMWVDEEDINILHLLRHFNGYNKHWIIDISVKNWRDSIQEKVLGEYGC